VSKVIEAPFFSYH